MELAVLEVLVIMSIFKFVSRFFHTKEIEFLINYIEGTISEDCFFHYLNNHSFYERLYKRASWDVFSSSLVERKLITNKLNSMDKIQKIALQSRLCIILDYYQIKYSIGVPELSLWKKWENYIPSFLDPSLELIEEMERIDPERKKTKKWHRERLKKTFPCFRYSPRWLQNCEWPLDDDGSRCVFLYQTGYPNSKDYIEYHFKKKTGEEIIIEQFD